MSLCHRASFSPKETPLRKKIQFCHWPRACEPTMSDRMITTAARIHREYGPTISW